VNTIIFISYKLFGLDYLVKYNENIFIAICNTLYYTYYVYIFIIEIKYFWFLLEVFFIIKVKIYNLYYNMFVQ